MSFVSHCALSALVAMAVTASPVYAAEYPERNITVIVPFPPGGASDMTARLVAAKFAERVKQSVVIDNRAGANGALGAGARSSKRPPTATRSSLDRSAFSPSIRRCSRISVTIHRRTSIC